MVKIKGNKELHLFSDEKILLQTKAIINKKTQKLLKLIFPLFGIAGFFLIGITIFILTGSISIIRLMISRLYISILFTLLASIFIFSFFFYLINEYNNSRTVYYFTSQRLIKWIEKKILYQRKKEIKYADISHLIDWYTALEIVPKNKNGQLYYEGDETEFFHKFRGLKSIKILLHGSKGKKSNKEIINLLVQGIPLKKHPNLEFLYFKEKLAKEKENIIMVREMEESNNEIEQEVSQISKRQIRIFLVGIISIIITFYILIWSGLIVLIILPIGIYCIMTYAILSLEKRKKLLKKKTKDKNL